MQIHLKSKKANNLNNKNLIDRPKISGDIPKVHLLDLLSYVLPPGPPHVQTVADIDKAGPNSALHRRGIWVLGDPMCKHNEEYGWVCIHWPTLLHRLAWNEKTVGHLSARGFSVRSLQQTPLRALERRQGYLDELKGHLAGSLPPGAVLEADNTMFQHLVGLFVSPEDFSRYDNSPLRDSLGPWTFFRFSALSKSSLKTFRKALHSYSPVGKQLLSNLDEGVVDQCPNMINVLLTCFTQARLDPGYGWQKWGLAWTKAGLVFNYGLALIALMDKPKIYAHLFADGSYDPSGNWQDPAYLNDTPPFKTLPRLGEIVRVDASAQNYMGRATEPYKYLFQDSNRYIQDLEPYHGLEHRVLFPIKGKGHNLFTYLQELRRISVGGEEVLKEVRPSRPRQSKVKNQAALLDPRKTAISNAPKTYLVQHDAQMLATLRAEPWTFKCDMIEYRKEYFFSLPSDLTDAFPELLETRFFDSKYNQHVLIWQPSPEVEAWQHAFIHPNKLLDGTHRKNYVNISFKTKDFHIARKNARNIPRVHKVGDAVYFHHSAFRPDGEIFHLLNVIQKNKPGLLQDERDMAAVLQTFWTWLYDPMKGLNEGRFAGEFACTLGREVLNVSKDNILNTFNKRLNYIAGKAKHSRDPHVGLMQDTDLRSREMNSYDDFVLWHVTSYEFPQLQWQFNKDGQAEYIIRRWLPWRRKSGILNHIPRSQIAVVPQRYHPAPPWSSILEEAQTLFGPSYSPPYVGA